MRLPLPMRFGKERLEIRPCFIDCRFVIQFFTLSFREPEAVMQVMAAFTIYSAENGVSLHLQMQQLCLFDGTKFQ